MRVTPGLDTINSFFIANTDQTLLTPDLDFGSGNYMVVWSESRPSVSELIYAARVTPQGNVLDPGGILVGPLDNTKQRYPQIAFGSAQFLAVWQAEQSGANSVAGRFINTDGTVGSSVSWSTNYAPLDIHIDFDGTNYLVIWIEPMIIKGQFISSAGSLVGSYFTVANLNSDQTFISMRYDGTNYLITYTDGGLNRLYGKKLRPDGQTVGSAFLISTDMCLHSDVYPGTGNRYLIVWNNGSGDIVGNQDIEIIGIAESGPDMDIAAASSVPTVIRSQHLLRGKINGVLYDITGRRVDPRNVDAGIYYVKVNGEIDRKIIVTD